MEVNPALARMEVMVGMAVRAEMAGLGYCMGCLVGAAMAVTPATAVAEAWAAMAAMPRVAAYTRMGVRSI